MSTLDLLLAIDVGQTGSRYAAVANGEQRVGSAPPLRAGAALVPALVAILEHVVGEIDHAIAAVAVGATGLNGRRPPVEELHRALAPVVGNAETVLADDCVTSYLGALETQPGAVVAAGTGVVVLASDGRSRSARVDGAGYLLGDAGSGFWIGRAGLEAAVRALDGRGSAAELRRAAEEQFGDLAFLPAELAGRDDRVAAVASFARSVGRLAADGDPASGAILASAARELAGSTAAALEGAGLDGESGAVAVVGALAGAGPVLLEPFERELAARCPGARLVPARGTSLDGAVRLASVDPSPFGRLVAVAGRRS